MIYLDEHIFDFDLEAALQRLSDQRRQQALKFKHELGQRTCVLSYLLLCQGLRNEYGIEEKPVFDYGEHGKPFIVAHPEIHFNLSHCREGVICVLDQQPVGVDIESVRPLHEGVMRYAMNEQEVAQIQAADYPALEFTRLWTMKEAVVKLSGEGISDNMKDILQDASLDMETVVDKDQRYVYSICTYGNSY